MVFFITPRTPHLILNHIPSVWHHSNLSAGLRVQEGQCDSYNTTDSSGSSFSTRLMASSVSCGYRSTCVVEAGSGKLVTPNGPHCYESARNAVQCFEDKKACLLGFTFLVSTQGVGVGGVYWCCYCLLQNKGVFWRQRQGTIGPPARSVRFGQHRRNASMRAEGECVCVCVCAHVCGDLVTL